tara:strand:+ start:1008 stop:1313 length:306 start_codon:yes stop_codon:yes gene_type:complete
MGTYLSNVKATNGTSSFAIFGGPCRILGIYYVADTTAGTITIKDGGSSGTSIAVFDTPKGVAANAGENVVGYIPIPGDGLHCATSGYATLSGVAKVTIFYG